MHATSAHWRRTTLILLALLLGACCASGFTWPWKVGKPWPRTSNQPVAPLDHPALATRLQESGWDASAGYQFVVFGDQRALADGEWQALISQISRLDRPGNRLLFVLDTGDIVSDGRHTDQFHMLREILKPVSHIPYLVCVGNHEANNNRPGPAREQMATFLGYLDEAFSPRRMYYRKDIGPVRFLFLDTNDFLYGDVGDQDGSQGPRPGSRAETQLSWLITQLAKDDRGEEATTVAVMHHPMIQSSSKHLEQAKTLWSYRYGDRALPDILVDGGVDLVLTGHTHTYERFRLVRRDGRKMRLINFSGRPRTAFLWFGKSERMPRGIAGYERDWLQRRGWSDLEHWEVIQEEAMVTDPANQFGLFAVSAQGEMEMEVFFLDEEHVEGVRRAPPVRLTRSSH